MIILIVSFIQLKDNDNDNMSESETNDNNTLREVPILFNGDVFDLAVTW